MVLHIKYLLLIQRPSLFFKVLSGQAKCTETTFPSIYNSLRYDDQANIVTFHISEKDWHELESNAFMWISSSDMNPVINRDLLFLGGETIERNQRVDPVEIFGLFSVQAFNVIETNANCQVLKVALQLKLLQFHSKNPE